MEAGLAMANAQATFHQQEGVRNSALGQYKQEVARAISALPDPPAGKRWMDIMDADSKELRFVLADVAPVTNTPPTEADI